MGSLSKLGEELLKILHILKIRVKYRKSRKNYIFKVPLLKEKVLYANIRYDLLDKIVYTVRRNNHQKSTDPSLRSGTKTMPK